MKKLLRSWTEKFRISTCVGVFAAVMLLALVLPAGALLLPSFAGGDGTELNPWQVATAEQLDMVGNYQGAAYTDKYFIQVADIDLGVSPWNEGAGWDPIGGWLDNVSFRGTYDGNGYTISNLTIDTTVNETYASLFGRVGYSAVLKNVRLEDISISGIGHLGGLTGSISGGIISNSSVTGTLSFKGTGYPWYGGGLAGTATSDTVIESSYADVSISAATGSASKIGGLVGWCNNLTILNSYATGDVDGAEGIGGLVGVVNGANIENSYAAGSVTGSTLTGGLLGVAYGVTLTNSFYDQDATGQVDDIGNGEPKTTAELMQQATFTDWEFPTVWRMAEGSTHPYLNWQTLDTIDGISVEVFNFNDDSVAGHRIIFGFDDGDESTCESTVADTITDEVEGEQQIRTSVSLDGKVRAVAITGTNGESWTWYEIYDEEESTWQKRAPTLSQYAAFMSRNYIRIEEGDDGGLQIIIKTKLKSELRF